MNKGGMIAQLVNIRGVTRLCVFDSSGKIIQTLRASEVNLENMEKIDE